MVTPWLGCATCGCSNRSEKGYHMYGFPKDQERREKWMAMVSRQNVQVTGVSNSQKLCNVHFEDDQFTATKRAGMLKLRPDAVPTVFIHRPKPKRRKPPSGQVILGQVIQGQVIQGQVIQGQVIQGQAILAQVIQGQVIQGQVIQGQVIQGQLLQGPDC
ncbi:unnamed protein product [Boreogadus saida]